MPRKYDRTIRYYDSWFADLMDPAKEFTADECWTVVLAIRECQISASLKPLENLPPTIRRALSMATMGEQIQRILERAENMRARSSAGGRAAASSNVTPEQRAATSIKREREDKAIKERERVRDAQRASAVKPEKYEQMLKEGAEGNAIALKQLRLDQEQCIQLCNKKNIRFKM